MTQKQSVVIIGGGPAGLTAAWELVKDGGSEQYDVTVLEATREFGGISRTVKHDGNRMDNLLITVPTADLELKIQVLMKLKL